jgi:hypothetical protein
MEIYVNGNPVTLTQKDFVAKGGEGKVFKRGSTAYKVYDDLSKMIAPAKIKELADCDHGSILRPKDLILNKKKQNIGFTMDWLGDNLNPLCKLFTTPFRERNGIENDHVIQLVENIKTLISFVHSKKCLIVDGNELNYLVKNDFMTPYIIDVNSWQTPSYPATAIMPSIRDWTTESFSVLTDWFSFGIVTFQLFVGIHPFKGKHKSYRKNDFINRIKDRVSVFNSNVSLPPSTRNFNIIPGAYKDWYYKIFENGDRLPPPVAPGTAEIVQVAIKLVQSTGNFEITMIFEIDGKILYHNPEMNITKTKDKLYIGKTDYKVSQGVEVLFTPLESVPVLIKIENEKLQMKPLMAAYTQRPLELTTTEMMIVDNTLYVKNKEKLIELDFRVMGGQTIVPAVKTIWTIEPLSSEIFSNVIYQSVLGRSYLCIPQPNKSGKSSFHSIQIPEIDNFKVIDAKYQNKVCLLIVHDGNNYNRITIIFDDKFQKYSFRIQKGIDYQPLNFIVLDNGVCVTITEDNAVEMFMNRTDKTDVKRIEDPAIDNTMKLCKDGTAVKFFKDNKVYRLKMK